MNRFYCSDDSLTLLENLLKTISSDNSVKALSNIYNIRKAPKAVVNMILTKKVKVILNKYFSGSELKMLLLSLD